MPNQKPQQNQAGLSEQELNQQQASTLPDRDAMSLLDVNADLDLSLDLAAPVDAAIAANANVAAPIDAAVAANVGSVGSDAVAVSQQDAIINQDVTGSAEATSEQSSDIEQ